MKKFIIPVIITTLFACSKNEPTPQPLENVSVDGVRIGGIYGSDSISTIKDKIEFTKITYYTKIDTTYGGDSGVVGCHSKTKAKITGIEWKGVESVLVRENLNVWDTNQQAWISTSYTAVDLANPVKNGKLGYEVIYHNGNKERRDITYDVLHAAVKFDFCRFNFGDSKAKNKEDEIKRTPNSFYNNWRETGPNSVTYKMEGLKGVHDYSPSLYLVYQADKLSKIYEVITPDIWNDLVKINRIGIPLGSGLPDDGNTLDWKFNDLNFRIEKVKIEGLPDPVLAVAISK